MLGAEQLIQHRFGPTGHINNSYSSQGGARGLKGPINLQHDEPSSEEIDSD